MKVPLLDLKAQYLTIKDEIKDAVNEVIENQSFILGQKVAEFESQIASYCGCQFGVGVSSGSDALLICLMAEGIGSGDEVITTPYTFFATAGAIARIGAKPVFVDIDPLTYNINSNLIEEKITTKTRAIIPVQLYGQCADMAPIMQIARQHGVIVIEDAAQAIGAEYVMENPKGRFSIYRAGSMGDYGCFSFFPSKNLGAFGDGGMVVTNDPEKAEKLRVMRAHGSKPKYFHNVIGGNFRLDTLQAAVLSVKLSYLDEWTAGRQSNAEWYSKAFAETGLVDKGMLKLPQTVWKEQTISIKPQKNSSILNLGKHYHIYNQYVIATPQRDVLQRSLGQKEIGTAIYYPLSLHLQGCFSDLKYKKGDFPISETAADQTLALPVYPELTEVQKNYVVEMVAEALSQ